MELSLFFYFFFQKVCYNALMNTLKRPEMKLANTKVSEKDMIYFSLGLEAEDYILPSERDNYLSDPRAVRLVQDVRAGKDLSGMDFSGINLKGADISGGHFAGSSFKGAIFYQTDAHAADFRDCDFSEAYFEDSDFSQAVLTGADFRKTYLRKLKTDDAQMDPDLEKRLSTMEFLIQKIESGEIDIHCLTRSELMCLDLRRLDMSKIDVSDMDLSMFNLEGVNLRGVYINPLQKLSMDQWQKDLLAVEQLNERKLKEEILKVVKSRQKELNSYIKNQIQINEIKSKNNDRPKIKQDEFERPQKPDIIKPKPVEIPMTDKPNNIMTPHKLGEQKRA